MRKQTLLSTAILAMALIAVVACGSSKASAGAEETDVTITAPSPQVVQVVGVASQSGLVGRVSPQAEPIQSESYPQSTAVAEPIDADAVVAAYEEVLGGIYDSALRSVVQVRVQQDRGQQGSFGNQQTPATGEGTGFVWSEEGYVVTNHHVVDSADRITLVFVDGSEFDASVVGSDAASDLAVLKIDLPTEGLLALPLGDSDQLNVGQLAVAIGSPFGQEFSMTSGIISALGRLLQAADTNYSNPEIIQTDAPVNPGNSGGPLLDRQGRVIGIISQIISSSGANSGVGFAVPVNTAKRVVPELIATGVYQHAYLGIIGASVNPGLAEANGLPEDTRGVFVVAVLTGGPADRAGLSGSTGAREIDGIDYPIGGSVITGIDGTPIDGMDGLIAFMADNSRPGDKVALELLITKGEQATVDATLDARPTAG